MGIGASDGAFYEDHFDRLTGKDGNNEGSGSESPRNTKSGRNDIPRSGVVSPPSGDGASVITPGQMYNNRDLDKVDETELGGREISFKTPLGASTEPAGALKSTGGGQTPEKDLETNFLEKLTGFKDPWGEFQRQMKERQEHPLTDEQRLDQAMAVGMAAGPGIMAGVKSATFGKAALYKAQNMELSGEHPDMIWHETGWEKGADGRWKYEIPDEGSKLNIEKLDMTDWSKEMLSRVAQERETRPKGWGEPFSLKDAVFQIPESGMKLSELVHHPELFKAYPHLKDIDVKPVSIWDQMNGIQGGMARDENTLYLANLKMDQMRSVVLHEIQHAVQNHEGFSGGANTDVFKSDRWKSLENTFNTVKNAVSDYVYKNWKDQPGKFYDFKNAIEQEDKLLDIRMRADEGSSYNKDQLNKIEGLIQEAKDTGVYDHIKKVIKGEDIARRYGKALYDKYQSVKGETEARNTQSRRNMNADERRQQSPRSTEDVPRDEQIWSPWDPQSMKDLHE